MSTRRARTAAVIFALAGVAAPLCGSAIASTSAAATSTSLPALLSCSNVRTTKPVSFVISCADANSELTKTTWTTWTATRATGTTTFGLNLCEPDCAASKITLFPKSTVVASTPVSTKKHGRLFENLTVTYTLKGTKQTFPMSWKGDTAFS